MSPPPPTRHILHNSRSSLHHPPSPPTPPAGIPPPPPPPALRSPHHHHLHSYPPSRTPEELVPLLVVAPDQSCRPASSFTMSMKTHLRRHQILSTLAPPTPIFGGLQPSKPVALMIHPPPTSVTSPTATTLSKVHILEKLEEFEGCGRVLVEETGSPKIDFICIIFSEIKDCPSLGIVAHPSEVNQIALGMSDGEIHVLEPSDLEAKWGVSPFQNMGTLPSISSNPTLSNTASEPLPR